MSTATHADLPLTPRQLEILTHVSNGEVTKEIAVSLFVCRHTVENHLYTVREKLGARSTTQAVAIALRKGLIP